MHCKSLGVFHFRHVLLLGFTEITATVKRATEKRATENWATGKLGNEKGVVGKNGNICVTAEKTATGKLGNGKKGNQRIAYWMNE